VAATEGRPTTALLFGAQARPSKTTSNRGGLTLFSCEARPTTPRSGRPVAGTESRPTTALLFGAQGRPTTALLFGAQALPAKTRSNCGEPNLLNCEAHPSKSTATTAGSPSLVARPIQANQQQPRRARSPAPPLLGYYQTPAEPLPDINSATFQTGLGVSRENGASFCLDERPNPGPPHGVYKRRQPPVANQEACKRPIQPG
jgi:hypothetical protein